MKTLINNISIVLMLLVAACLSACSSDEDDSRAYEAVSVVGVKVDGTLYLPQASADSVVVNMPSGTDLSNVKVRLLVENGTAPGFVDDAEYDMRKPMDVALDGFDGNSRMVKLCVMSAPKLTSLSIAHVDVPAGNVYASSKSVIVQVAPGTDLTSLAVTMEFVNGTMVDFENGVERDYTSPVSFSVLGVDGTTVYRYQLAVTTDPVGPATIKGMTINGHATTKVVVRNDSVTPYVAGLSDFSNVTVAIDAGYGNEIEPSFTGQGVNLLGGVNKVTITGTNGQPTEFTILTPQLDPEKLFVNSSASMGLNGNDLGAVGFSGGYVLTTSTGGTKAPAWFDLSGNRLGQLSTDGCAGIGYGFRKFATDADGVVIGSSLGMSSGEQWVYRWDELTGAPVEYLSFSMASLGVSYSPRAAGINVSGSLKGNATITMAMAQQSDVFVWKVTNGKLGEPQKLTAPVKFGYYASVEPLPGDKGFLIAAATSGLNGIVVTDSRLNEQFRVTGMTMTDVAVAERDGRSYIAYTVIVDGNKPTMRVCDVTDGQEQSYLRPIMSMEMADKASNGNATTDAAFAVIDGKLHAAFASTNSDLYLFRLEQ